MKMKVILPSKILVDIEVDKIIIEGEEGLMGILPNHIDVAVSVVSGILSYFHSGTEKFIAHGEGLMVKKGEELKISLRQAVKGEKLGTLKKILEDEIKSYSEVEKKSRSTVAMFVSSIIKKFREQQRFDNE
jgi:F-type H+-transporting ATPase subunit epsilon